MTTGYEKARAVREELDNNTVRVSSEETEKTNVSLSTNEQEKGLSVIDDAYFTDNMRLGTEQLTPDDLATPTLTIIQPNNKLTDDDGRPYARGKFFYSGTKEIFDSVNVSFLVFSKADLPSFADKTVMQKNYIYFGAIMPGAKLFKLYLRSTGIGQAKKFNSDVVALKKPMYTLDVTLSSSFVQGENGDYYKIEFKINGVRTNPEEILMLEDLTRQFGEEVKRNQEVVTADEIPF